MLPRLASFIFCLLAAPLALANVLIAPSSALKGDIKHFSLRINYNGQQPKEILDSLTISTMPEPPSSAVAQGSLYVQVTPAEAEKVIDAMAADGDIAFVPAGEAANENGPCYVIICSVTAPQALLYQKNLGFDLSTFQHLDAIRAALEGEAAKKMDQLLDRAADVRKTCQTEGRVFQRDGLQICTKGPAKPIGPGSPLTIDLKVRNVEDHAITLNHGITDIAQWNTDIKSADGKDEWYTVHPGQHAPPAGGPITLKAGESVDVTLSFEKCQYVEKPKKFPAKMVSQPTLPPGKYTIALSADFAAINDSPAPSWFGLVTTAAMPLEAVK